MADLIEHPGKPASAAAVPDRRRPGRVEYHDPHLIALLRQQKLPDAAQAPTHVEPVADLPGPEQSCGDGLVAARGIGLAVLLGAVGWGGIAAAWRLLFGR